MIIKTVTETYEDDKLVSRTTEEEFLEDPNKKEPAKPTWYVGGLTSNQGINSYESASSEGFKERYNDKPKPPTSQFGILDNFPSVSAATLTEAVTNFVDEALDKYNGKSVR